MKRLEELIEDQGDNYILPFFWMHGEEHDRILEELEAVRACGIKEICIESRPHPDFCGPKWWSDVDLILSDAKKNNKRVWILDDDKFPTGHANGAYEKKYPELSKVYLAERHMDLVGPTVDNSVLIRPFVGKEGRLIKVLAIGRDNPDDTALNCDKIIDLTDKVSGEFVYFDLPEGSYRLIVIFITKNRGGRESYMNLIDSRSVRVLIDEVYEKHYERYKDYFGTTLAGFFSDEPELGNTLGYSFHDTLGKEEMKLPWSDELEVEIINSLGKDYGLLLPALWFNMGENTALIRSTYMDKVSSLVYRCFSNQIGEWCSLRGVEYIGHIIEDDNAHARLGCSVGHFFREQKGRHMAGVDVVHYQIVPGCNDKIHQWLSWNTDGEFFHFGLGKLGSSAAHIDPKKKGRAMCEIFGNYGWAEGVSFMKWLLDHMLVRGINYYVPHAFSPKYPDRDCPPHFYAEGNNPQFKFFGMLMEYLNRMCHLLNGGSHIADVAVLYHGDSEWTGKEVQLFQKPVRALMEAQLDCDVIPADVLHDEDTLIKNGKLIIHKESYEALVIPYCECIPKDVVDFVIKAIKSGLNVYMIDKAPNMDTYNNPLTKEFMDGIEIVGLENISYMVKLNHTYEMECMDRLPNLRFYCYSHGEEKIYLYFNEDTNKSVDTIVTIYKDTYSSIKEYIALNNKVINYRIENNQFRLQLEPGELKVFIPSKDIITNGMPKCVSKQVIETDWKITLLDQVVEATDKNNFIIKVGEKLPNMNGPDYCQEYSGRYRYEGSFYIKSKKDIGITSLYFPAIGDCAEIILNGGSVKELLASPGRVDVSDSMVEGINYIQIDVANTLVWKLRDGVSAFMQLKPTGMTKNPVLEFYE